MMTFGEQMFGWLGAIFAISFSLSPISFIINLIKGKIKYGEVPGLILIMTYFSCFTWIIYGIQIKTIQVIFTNLACAICNFIFSMIFLVYLSKVHPLFGFALIATLITLSSFEFYYLFFIKNSRSFTSKICIIMNIMGFCSPLETLFKVFITKNYLLISRFLAIMMIACSGNWLLFGIFTSDMTLIIPNLVGLFFGITQLIFYSFYKKKKNSNKEQKTTVPSTELEKQVSIQTYQEVVEKN